MATNFLWYAGSSNQNGLLTSSAINLMTTELGSLGSSITAVSTIAGTAGVLTSSNTGQGIYAELFLTYVSSQASTLATGATLTGWFLKSYDGGTTFETAFSSIQAQPRSPDFIISMSANAVGAGTVFPSANLVRLPAVPFKTYVQNNTGVALSTTITLIAAPIAEQY